MCSSYEALSAEVGAPAPRCRGEAPAEHSRPVRNLTKLHTHKQSPAAALSSLHTLPLGVSTELSPGQTAQWPDGASSLTHSKHCLGVEHKSYVQLREEAWTCPAGTRSAGQGATHSHHHWGLCLPTTALCLVVSEVEELQEAQELPGSCLQDLELAGPQLDSRVCKRVCVVSAPQGAQITKGWHDPYPQL